MVKYYTDQKKKPQLSGPAAVGVLGQAMKKKFRTREQAST
jgi:hypothetical protein